MMTTTCVATIIVASHLPPPFVHWASGGDGQSGIVRDASELHHNARGKQ